MVYPSLTLYYIKGVKEGYFDCTPDSDFTLTYVYALAPTVSLKHCERKQMGA